MLVHTSSNNCNVNKKISARKVIFFMHILGPLVKGSNMNVEAATRTVESGIRIQSHADNTQGK